MTVIFKILLERYIIMLQQVMTQNENYVDILAKYNFINYNIKRLVRHITITDQLEWVLRRVRVYSISDQSIRCVSILAQFMISLMYF